MRWRERIEYRVDDRVLVVNRSGTTDVDAPLIVLVHGIGAGPHYWRRLAEAIGQRARVEVVELPGHASSPPPASRMAIDDHARLLASYLRRAGHRRVVLAGHSMGAQVVSRAANIAPEVLARVLLLGPVVDPKAPTALGQARLLALDTLRETPGANRGVFLDYLRCGVRWYAKTLPAMLDFDTLEEARRLRDTGLPVTLVRGRRDPIASAEWCRRLARAAGGADPLVFEGSAHVVMWTSALEVAHELLRAVGPTPADVGSAPGDTGLTPGEVGPTPGGAGSAPRDDESPRGTDSARRGR